MPSGTGGEPAVPQAIDAALGAGACVEPAREANAERGFRRLKTCGHFGKPAATSENSRPLFREHGVETKAPKTPPRTAPLGCRPRSAACVTFFLLPALPLRGPLCRSARRRSQSGLHRFGGCHLFLGANQLDHRVGVFAHGFFLETRGKSVGVRIDAMDKSMSSNGQYRWSAV